MTSEQIIERRSNLERRIADRLEIINDPEFDRRQEDRRKEIERLDESHKVFEASKDSEG